MGKNSRARASAHVRESALARGVRVSAIVQVRVQARLFVRVRDRLRVRMGARLPVRVEESLRVHMTVGVRVLAETETALVRRMGWMFRVMDDHG